MLRLTVLPAQLPPAQRVMVVLWPAFVAAAVLEMLVFAAVDPQAVPLLGEGGLDWSRSAVYSVSFFVFWAVASAAAGVSVWLAGRPAP